MVAVRSGSSEQTGVFDFERWVDTLQLSSAKTRQCLTETWARCCYLAHADEKEKQKETALASPLQYGLEIVEILATLNMDSATLCAALLLPLAARNLSDIHQLQPALDNEISTLISGVYQMDVIRQLSTIRANTSTHAQVDNIRRMLLAIVEDFRCVIIKLAERIVYLRAMRRAPEEERVLAAKECFNIYAPLANRLGIGQLKWELEDYCFRYLHPDNYQQIAKLLDERRVDRERYIEDFVNILCQAMQKEGVSAEIYGRPKHIYSIWRKMCKKKLTFDELFDVRAIRIVAERLQDCYGALGIVHTLYKHLPDEFDDYVANPKPNGYQSIHTVVLGPDGKTVEIQIRTRQMHESAELGVAAHWRYKENTTVKRDTPGHEERIAWLRKLLAWQEEMADSGELLEEIRSQVFDDRVYVFTPKGDVIDLPVGSTPLDFAYHIHSDVGHRCIGAKVSGRIVPFTYQLRMGDQIEIITQKRPNPSRDWLNSHLGYVTTSRGRAKIHAWFRKQDRGKNMAAGKQMLEGELSQLNLHLKEVETWLLPRYNVTNLEDLLVGIGSGDIRLNQVIHFLQAQLQKPDAEAQDREVLRQISQKASTNHAQDKSDHVIVEGVGNLLHHTARCCRPIPGDTIMGFITRGRGISIHRTNCDQLAELISQAPERIVEATWGEHYSSGYTLVLRVTANDRSGLLRDITTILANEKINVLGVSSRSDTRKQIATIDMEVEIYNQYALNRVLSKLNQLTAIIEARRLY